MNSGRFTVSGCPVVSGSTNSVGAAEWEERYFVSDDPGYHVERDGSKLLLVEGAISPSFTDPEGREIGDQALVEWLSANNFTQSDINALGSDSAATEKLYECWLLNCSITAANPGGALGIIGFAACNGQISVTVQLVRQSPLGYINGVLYLYCADDLAEGFYIDPIANEIIAFGDGDSTFDIAPGTAPASGSVTQTVTATFDPSLVSEKFFMAAIEFARSEEPSTSARFFCLRVTEK